MEQVNCFLNPYTNCVGGDHFVDAGVENLRTVSNRRGDDLHEHLSIDADVKYSCHKTCVSTCTVSHHIKIYISQKIELKVGLAVVILHSCPAAPIGASLQSHIL